MARRIEMLLLSGLLAVCVGNAALAADPEKPVTPDAGAQPAATPAAETLKVEPLPPVAPRPGMPVPAGLLEQIQVATGAFAPVSAEQLTAARSTVSEAVAGLDAYLKPQGANGQAWHKFLLTADLKAQLTGAADPAALAKIHKRYTSANDGLELEPFLAVNRALGRYKNLATAAANPNAKLDYQAQLKTIADGLQAAAKEAKPELLNEISQAVAALDRSERAPVIVAAVRSHYSRPNLFFRASEKLVATGMSRDIDDVAPLRDNINGTRITGTGHTIGKLTANLLADDDLAWIQTVMTGVNHARTVGRNGPAIIYSTGYTQLHGIKHFYVDSEGFHTLPAEVSLNLQTRVTGVATTKRGLMDRIIKNVAWKKIPQEQAKGRAIAQSRAKKMFQQRLDSEAAEQLAQVNHNFDEKFRKPLLLRGQFPEVFHVNTTSDDLHARLLQSGGDFFGAQFMAPPVIGEPELAIQAHESSINNTAAGLLAGVTLTKEGAEELSLKLTGKLPERLEDDEDDKGPWSITFAAPEPVTVRIDDNLVTIVIRGEKYTSGNKAYDAMYVTARYRLEHRGQEVCGRRLGDLEILPPGFVSGRDRLAVRQTVLKRLLQKRFGKIFEPEFVTEGLTLPNQYEKVGTLSATQLVADNGWLVIGWTKLLTVDRPTEPKLAERTTAGEE